MMNPMLQALQPQTQIKDMVNLVRSSGNPNAALEYLARTNPQIRQVMNMVNQSGGDPRAAFYSLAKQKGVDPNQILNMLK